jgi:uncharacterized protein (TIGR02646 family)
MIKINKSENAPEALTTKQQEIAPKLCQTLLEGKKFKWDGIHFSEPIKEELKKLYHNKCGFCEQILGIPDTDNQYTVEHYRPKSGRNDYNWLGNEWTNLIPLCKGCNHNKGDDFPILHEKNRVRQPPFDENKQLIAAQCKANSPELLAEKPVFLHPEIDDATQYFVFELYRQESEDISENAELTINEKAQLGISGKAKLAENLSGIDKNRAEKMLLKFLNRSIIEQKRKKKLINFLNQWRQILDIAVDEFSSGTPQTPKNVELLFIGFFSNLKAEAAPSAEFSRLGYFMCHDFDALFITYLKKINHSIDSIQLGEYAYLLLSKKLNFNQL